MILLKSLKKACDKSLWIKHDFCWREQASFWITLKLKSWSFAFGEVVLKFRVICYCQYLEATQS